MGKDRTLYAAGCASEQGRLSSLVVKFNSNGLQPRQLAIGNMTDFPVVASVFNIAADIDIQSDGKPVVCGWAMIAAFLLLMTAGIMVEKFGSNKKNTGIYHSICLTVFIAAGFLFLTACLLPFMPL